MANQQTAPASVVAIATDNDGRVSATVSDFNPGGSNGVSLAEAQEWRARDRLTWAVVDAYCSDVVVKAIDRYTAEKIMERLMQAGMKRTFVRIGHEEVSHA